MTDWTIQNLVLVGFYVVYQWPIYYDSIIYNSCVIFIFGSTCNGKLRCLTSLFYFNIEQIQKQNLNLHFKLVVLFTNIKINFFTKQFRNIFSKVFDNEVLKKFSKF